MNALLKLYPGAWRARYGEEMEALLDDRRPGPRERVDLIRGAVDAWLHPESPSRVPATAALLGGGLWTVVAAAVLSQPTPTDWPGYIVDVLGLAMVAAGFLLVATLACALRTGGRGRRPATVAIAITILGHVAWIGALSGTAMGVTDAPALAAAQTLAMVGAALIGLVLVRDGQVAIGILVLVGSAVMLIPITATWLGLGVAWSAIGWLLIVERMTTPGTGWRVS